MNQNLPNEIKAAASGISGDSTGKYLTFMLGEENYGVEILKVREIIGLTKIIAVPHTPTYVQGVINLRGKVIPVIDLRLKFDLPSIEETEETCIIVTQISDTEIGVIVDKVSEVQNIANDQIQEPPTSAMQIKTNFLLGMAKVEERVIILLRIDEILTSDDIEFAQDQLSKSDQVEETAQAEDAPQNPVAAQAEDAAQVEEVVQAEMIDEIEESA